MLLFRSSQANLLIGFLLIAQGLCQSIPSPEQKSRIVRDTADLPTELFKPVGKNPGNESTYNRANSTGEPYTVSDESDTPVRFLERSDGKVEVVTAEYDEEEENNRDWEYNSQSSRRTSGFPIPPPSYESSFQPDPRGVLRFTRPESSIIGRPPFPSSSGFRGSDTRSIFSPENSIHNTPSWISRPIQVPIASNNFRRQFTGTGSSDPFGSSNNFHRSESFSYTSDGRGPPKIEQNVYDSRNGLGGVSIRNF